MPRKSENVMPGKHRLKVRSFRCANSCCPGILLNRDKGWGLIYEERTGQGGVKFSKKQLRMLAEFLIEEGFAEGKKIR